MPEIIRNIPQQVAKNARDIQRIKDVLNMDEEAKYFHTIRWLFGADYQGDNGEAVMMFQFVSSKEKYESFDEILTDWEKGNIPDKLPITMAYDGVLQSDNPKEIEFFMDGDDPSFTLMTEDLTSYIDEADLNLGYTSSFEDLKSMFKHFENC